MRRRRTSVTDLRTVAIATELERERATRPEIRKKPRRRDASALGRILAIRSMNALPRRSAMAAKKTGRKYSKAASNKVGKAMHERKHGTLRSGSSGKKVTSKKQAIAIGLSEARRAGKKVPRKSSSSSHKKGGSHRKSSHAKSHHA
jgi:hypothetical protein